jgi:phosphoglycerol transferase MdoB-like AlkP superfamily enzyme
MPAKSAAALVDSLYTIKKDTTIHILNTKHPNVIMIQLEGCTADVIESLGGEKGVSPNFETFIKQGVLFDEILASADRTDKGIIAILSAFPSQATRTIIVDNDRQAKMPSLINVFKDNGYGTSYFYGGESEFMNFKAYILSHKTDELFDKKVFRPEDMNSKWGAHDDIVLSKQLKFLNTQKQPFFSYLQTLTNHEPFELPVKPRFPGEELSDKFRSTSYYVDASLKAYFDEAKKHEWYKNTLFILVADHGHRLPRNTSDPFEPEKYHIPLLFFGDAIKPEYRGTKINKMGGQTDIAATLLAQLNLPHKQFKWSKNLLNPYTKEFAFFDWDNGFGLSLPQQTISYDNAGNRVIYIRDRNVPHTVNDKILEQGKAYLQQVFTDYMNY